MIPPTTQTGPISVRADGGPVEVAGRVAHPRRADPTGEAAEHQGVDAEHGEADGRISAGAVAARVRKMQMANGRDGPPLASTWSVTTIHSWGM